MNILPAIHHSYEHDGCVDSSPASKSDWMNRLHRGCLSKDTSDKYRLYSHLRALPTRNISDPDAQATPSTRRKSSLPAFQRFIHAGYSNIDEECETELSEPAMSPVLREDSSRPPASSDEVVPELFAVNEFFDYLWSDKWREEICLRVVGGELLRLLLTALYDLERRQKINSHIIRANLNNRRKYETIEDHALSECSVKRLSSNKSTSSAMLNKRRRSSNRKVKGGHKKHFKNTNNNESSYAPDLPVITISKPQNKSFPHKGKELQQEELRCESLVIQLILYEKAEASNVAYTTSDEHNSDHQSSMKNPLPRHVLFPAYSQTSHRMKYVRLPISEDVDTKEQVTKLTSELDDMLKITTNRCTVDSMQSPVNFANLTEKLNKLKHKKHSVHNGSKKGTPVESRDSKDQGLIKHDKASKIDKQMEGKDCEDVTDNVWFHSSSLIRCEEDVTEIVPPETKTDDSNSLLSLNDDVVTSAFKKLNLSCKEMYITGLYVPRSENKVSIDVKLQRAKVPKHIVYHDKNPEYSSKYKSTGAYEQPKCPPLPRRNTHSRKPYHSPDLRTKRQIKDDNVSEQLWNQYIKEQEQMEMEVALNNSLAVNRVYKFQNANISFVDDKTTTIDGANTTRKRKAKKVNGQTVADRLKITGEEDAPSQLSSTDAQPQINRRLAPNRPEEELPFSFDMTSEKEQLDTEMILDKTQLAINFNSNSMIYLPRRRIFSKKYLYVHEFQEPCTRTPRPPSEYEQRRSYQIMNQTPYAIAPVDDGDSNFRRSEINYNFSDKYPRRIYPVNIKMKDGNWLNHHDCNEQVDTSSEPELGCSECPCAECQRIREALADLKPDTTFLAPGYSCRLGKLRKDFNFLQIKNDGSPKEVKDAEIVSHFVTMGVPQICDHLMRLIENVMIRKEILISSFSETYITVTFSKEKTSKI